MSGRNKSYMGEGENKSLGIPTLLFFLFPHPPSFLIVPRFSSNHLPVQVRPCVSGRVNPLFFPVIDSETYA